MKNSRFFEEPKEHSKVKAAIVSEYFYAWAKVILSGRTGKIGYIDLFAGPGKYKDGTSSTPLLVLEKAIQDKAVGRSLITVFGDERKEYIATLEANVQNLPGVDVLAQMPQFLNEEVGDHVAQKFQGRKLFPTLLFLDPWGYKGLSLRLIESVVKDWACECVFFFNYNRINAGLSNSTVESHINDIFGKEGADDLRSRLKSLPARERRNAILKEIENALLTQTHGKYVLTFRFMDRWGTRLSHCLVFVTKHPKGYEIMKEIMASKSSRHDQGVASFEFNPRDIYQARMEMPALHELENELLAKFAGRTLTMLQIYEQHNVGTPYIKKNYKDTLIALEARDAITAERHRKGTFGDNVPVTFPPKEVK